MFLVSVVIPNYNHSAFLKKRIDSVLNQTYQNIELILLDDCSADTSRDVIEAFKDHPKVSHIVYNEVNTGNTFTQWVKEIELEIGKWV